MRLPKVHYTQSGQVKQLTADLILLDNLLAEYGPEARPIRENMPAALASFADKLWREKQGTSKAPFTTAAGERVFLDIQTLSPRTDLQRSLQSRAIQVANDLTQLRLLLFVESDSSIPAPFLAVLVVWLFIIFTSFSLFASFNPTVLAVLSLSALSAAGAIFLVLELGQPFSGLMAISSGAATQRARTSGSLDVPVICIGFDARSGLVSDLTVS